MVSIYCEESKAEIRFGHNPVTVAVELATAINGIYSGLTSQSPKIAEAFREALMICLQEGSPAWERKPDMTMITVPVRQENQHGDS